MKPLNKLEGKIADVMASWLDEALSTSGIGWSPIDGYKGNYDKSEEMAQKDYDKYLIKAVRKITNLLKDRNITIQLK